VAVLYAACPTCGRKKRKPKGTELPPRVWQCAICGALYRVSRTHQPSLWRKAVRRESQGRGPRPVEPQYKTYLVELFAGPDGKRKARKIESASHDSPGSSSGVAQHD
jgi:hypothetical protein